MSARINMPQTVFAAIFLVILIGSGFLAFAKDQAGLDLLPQGKNIFFAVIAALIWGLGGYIKQAKPEDFDPVKFLTTVIISIFIGFAMYYLKLDYTAATSMVQTFLVNEGLLAAIETWLKAIVRQFGSV